MYNYLLNKVSNLFNDKHIYQYNYKDLTCHANVFGYNNDEIYATQIVVVIMVIDLYIEIMNYHFYSYNHPLLQQQWYNEYKT